MSTTATVDAPLVAAVEDAGAGVRDRHQDVPEVVVTNGSGIDVNA